MRLLFTCSVKFKRPERTSKNGGIEQSKRQQTATAGGKILSRLAYSHLTATTYYPMVKSRMITPLSLRRYYILLILLSKTAGKQQTGLHPKRTQNDMK